MFTWGGWPTCLSAPYSGGGGVSPAAHRQLDVSQLYAFVVGYAFFIYVICAVLFPTEIEPYDGFKDYFMARRRWFFGMLIAWLAIDMFDTWAKGPAHFRSLGARISDRPSRACFGLPCRVAESPRAGPSCSFGGRRRLSVFTDRFASSTSQHSRANFHEALPVQR